MKTLQAQAELLFRELPISFSEDVLLKGCLNSPKPDLVEASDTCVREKVAVEPGGDPLASDSCIGSDDGLCVIRVSSINLP
jgi:hypothetical protein